MLLSDYLLKFLQALADEAYPPLDCSGKTLNAESPEV